MTDQPRPDEIDDHAFDRFLQRFPGEDFDAVFGRAVPLALETALGWAKANGRPYRLHHTNVVWWDAETGAAFVCKPTRDRGLLLVTCFPIRKPRQARGKAADKKRYPYRRDRGKVGYEPEEDERAN